MPKWFTLLIDRIQCLFQDILVMNSRVGLKLGVKLIAKGISLRSRDFFVTEMQLMHVLIELEYIIKQVWNWSIYFVCLVIYSLLGFFPAGRIHEWLKSTKRSGLFCFLSAIYCWLKCFNYLSVYHLSFVFSSTVLFKRIFKTCDINIHYICTS